MKKIILGIVVFVVVLGGGAGYWYFKVYQPRQVAKELLTIYRDFQVNMQNAASQPDVVFFKKESLLVVESTRTKLNELKPTEQVILVRKDFIAYLDATKHFLTIFRVGPVDKTISDAVENQTKLGNDLDSKIEELLKTYPELKPLTEK